MDENEMDLDEPATRRDLKELETATRRDLNAGMSELRTEMLGLETRLSELIRAGFANHPTHAQLDASLRQAQLHIESTAAQYANASAEVMRAEMAAQLAQQTNAIREDLRSVINGLDDRYRDLPKRVTKLETAVFPPPSKRKRKTG